MPFYVLSLKVYAVWDSNSSKSPLLSGNRAHTEAAEELRPVWKRSRKGGVAAPHFLGPKGDELQAQRHEKRPFLGLLN